MGLWTRPESAPASRLLRRIVWLCVLLWTVILGAAAYLHGVDSRAATRQAALTIAEANFAKDQVLRLWAARHGGVYVSIGEQCRPSPWLDHVPERDLTSTGGRQLTLVDPANLVRQLSAEFPELYGITGHVTSSHPLRPENAPDSWEARALRRLAAGDAEVAEFTQLDGAPHLRLMRPMTARDECLGCHSEQSTRLGQTIGGVSVSVPLAPLQAAERRQEARVLWVLGALWLLGGGGIVLAGHLVGLQMGRRRQVVEELRRAHELLQREHAMYRDGPVVVLQCREQEGLPVEHITANVAQVLGYEAAMFLDGAMTLAGIVHADDLARVTAAVRDDDTARDDGLDAGPVRLRHRDGRTVWALAQFAAGQPGVDGIRRARGYLIDVTGWHEAESALRESEDRLELALDGAGLGVWDWDIVSNRVVFDERFVRMLGHEPGELDDLLATWSSRIHPDDVAMVNRALDDHLAGRTPGYRTEHRLRAKDGSWLWILDSGRVIARDAEGRPLRAVGVHLDISARRNAEHGREEALERFTALIDNLHSGVMVLSADRRIVQANRPFCDMFGLGESSGLIGEEARHTATVVAQQMVSPEGFLALVENSVSAGRLETGVEIATKDGRLIERDYVPIRIDDRLVGHLSVLHDVTSRRRLEREAVRQERLAAVGQLAAGIAHDFNNILCSIMGFTELLQTTPGLPDSAQPHLGRIAKSSRRAATLVRQIVDFSGRTVQQAQRVDFDECVNETVGFLRASLPENIRIEHEVAPGSYPLDAEPAQLKQMITNLAINARDAMPGGGRLRLRLWRGPADDPEALCMLCGQQVTGSWLRLDMADTGTGIAPEVLPRIFEPFFTTKKVGEGTGLGLPQAVGIAAQHGGHILVTSQPGRGSVFTILLPPAEVQEQAVTSKRPLPQSGQGQNVLLVEDEPGVREALAAMLGHLNYRVTLAASGGEALARFARPGARFDLVLTDVVMPDLDGETLCDQLLRLDPAAHIVAMSGYPLGERGEELLERGVLAWVQKPISIEQLAAVVATSLVRSPKVRVG